MKNKPACMILTVMAIFLFALTTPQPACAEAQAVYKVFLVTSEGTPASEATEITVSFYDESSGGSPYWSETQTVTPESGLYILQLGQVNSFNLALDMPYYVGVQVGGAGEDSARMYVNGEGSFSQKGRTDLNQELNIKYEWLDILAQ